VALDALSLAYGNRDMCVSRVVGCSSDTVVFDYIPFPRHGVSLLA